MNETLRQPSFLGHLQLLRVDHWIKNVFVFPGVAVAFGLSASSMGRNQLVFNMIVGLVSVCLIASSNYTINEVLDAPFDLKHPTKCRRPVPSGLVNVSMAYVQWITLMVLGLFFADLISVQFTMSMFALWLMGCVYNFPPIRTKDLPYIDVISEAVNNPLRMLAGWYIVSTTYLPPLSLLLSYWMVGAYFMAIKRYAELKEIGDSHIASCYRKSFAYYTEPRLLTSIVFFGATAMLFFATFCTRYRLELILSYPLIALVMAVYFSLAFKKDSAAQAPEKLYKEPYLILTILACLAVMSALLFYDIPILDRYFPARMIKIVY